MQFSRTSFFHRTNFRWRIRLVAPGSALVALLLFLTPGCGAGDNDGPEDFLTLALAGSLSRIYMFSDANDSAGWNGGLGGRSGADNICFQRKLEFSGLLCANVRAFLSVSADDSIAGMPDNYGVPEDRIIEGPGGALIGNSWSDLLDGQLSDAGSFRSAGLFTDVAGNPPYFWTGAGTSDAGAQNTCNGWNDGASGQGDALSVSQNAGFSNTTLLNCLDQEDPNGNPKSIVCLCW